MGTPSRSQLRARSAVPQLFDRNEGTADLTPIGLLGYSLTAAITKPSYSLFILAPICSVPREPAQVKNDREADKGAGDAGDDTLPEVA